MTKTINATLEPHPDGTLHLPLPPELRFGKLNVTAWEVAIKLSLGRLRLNSPYDVLFPGAVLANGFQVLAMKLGGRKGKG